MVTFRIQGRLCQPDPWTDPITITTRVPPTTTLKTTQPPSPDLTGHHEEQPESGESPQTPSSEEGTNASHVANLLEDVKYFHNAALGYQDAYESSSTTARRVAV